LLKLSKYAMTVAHEVSTARGPISITEKTINFKTFEKIYRHTF